jgi:hypothetical protein
VAFITALPVTISAADSLAIERALEELDDDPAEIEEAPPAPEPARAAAATPPPDWRTVTAAWVAQQAAMRARLFAAWKGAGDTREHSGGPYRGDGVWIVKGKPRQLGVSSRTVRRRKQAGLAGDALMAPASLRIEHEGQSYSVDAFALAFGLPWRHVRRLANEGRTGAEILATPARTRGRPRKPTPQE